MGNTSISWFDWAPGQPDDYHRQQCLTFLRYDYGDKLTYNWNDWDCNADADFICEKVCDEPTTEPPTTEPPTTEPPTTEPPTTEAPTTEAPTTEPATTEHPTTEAPTTEDSPPTVTNT